MPKVDKPWLDEAGKFQIEHVGGIPHFNKPVSKGPRTGVLHTTEASWKSSMNEFRQHYAPHFLLGYDAVEQRVRIAQLVQVGTIGAALKANNKLAIVQVEMIGYSKETSWLPEDETADALASLMAACAKEYGIPLTHPWPDGDYGKYGPNPHRESGKFGTEAGWYGHGDVPSPDNHWDPGNLRWSVILGKAKDVLDTLGTADAEAGPHAMALNE
jgi:hypothetical protein